MKFIQALNENYITETTITQLATAIKNKNPNMYGPLQVIKADNGAVNPLTYDEAKQALVKFGIDVEKDPKLASAIRSATAEAERSRQVMQSRRGYGIGQERIALARSRGLLPTT